MPSGATPSSSPARVGRYEILARIASGGMATVFLARQTGAGGFSREVALKLTHAHLREEEHWTADLVEEAKVVSLIRHANVVPVLDVDDDPEGVFLVMEYVPGVTLQALMRRDSSPGGPVGVAMAALLDGLAGLQAAHDLCDATGKSLALVHRDFSPQNILVGIDGVGRLTDFGIAKVAGRLGFTRTGHIKGKFGYMAPEQARDEPLDVRADVWSAGVVAWELLVGERMHGGADAGALLLRVVRDSPRRPRSIDPNIHPALEEAVMSALTMDREARCPSASELRLRLIAACDVSGLKISSREESARYVSELAAPVLEERRRKVVQLDPPSSGTHAIASSAGPADREAETEGSFATDQGKARGRRWRAAAVTASVLALVFGMMAWAYSSLRSASPGLVSPSPTASPAPVASNEPEAPAWDGSVAAVGASATARSTATVQDSPKSHRPTVKPVPRGPKPSVPVAPPLATAAPPSPSAGRPRLHESTYSVDPQ